MSSEKASHVRLFGAFLLDFGPGIAECHRTVEDRQFIRAVPVLAEIAHTLELHRFTGPDLRHGRLKTCAHGPEGVRIDVIEERLPLRNIVGICHGEKLFIQPHLSGKSVLRAHPVNGALDLAAVRAVASAGSRVVGTVNFLDIALGILHDIRAGNKIGITQPHFLPGGQAVVLLRRIEAEVIAVDVEFPGEGNLAGSEGIVVRISKTSS